jgi:hypothetical protein
MVRPLSAKQNCLIETPLERGVPWLSDLQQADGTYTRSKRTENSKEMFRSHRQ